ncbi:Protein phosphatase 1 regulatory subunit 37 [Fasciola gigantica]|uniref:Protein phosphatase 1 regulatory subunit 37 n=1 Tax=Fasciola gigantica TaxID=46835 RepID=A0A504ZCD4_FASGI|nr:Protein phosphatase 1 regulatory subunit 37 [Fasciola gigantica]
MNFVDSFYLHTNIPRPGIRLSRSHVETLEEIFRRVHFRELDFEGTFLDDQSAVALFDMLLHYETCHELHISLSLDKFHPSLGWARCVTFMRRSGELRRFSLSHTPLTIGNFLGLNFFGLCLNGLSLRDCNLSGQALFGLVRWLRLLLSSASLDPPSRDKSGGAGNNSSRTASRRSGSSSLVNAVARRSHLWCPVLLLNPETGMREPSVWNLRLDVAQNRLNATDAETLLALVRHQLLVPQIPPDMTLSGTPNSVPLNVSNGDVNPEPVILRKEWLPIGGIGFLSSLDLSNNSLGDDGLRVICTGLIQSYRTRLRDLHSEATPVNTVEDHPSQTDASVTCSTLNTTTNSEREPDGSVNVAVELKASVRGLERLSLSNNGLTSTGMQAMALVLMQTPSSLVQLVGGLTSLDLSNNPGIRDEGVEVLCEGLIRNHSLKELYLRAIRMSFSGIFALSGFLTESKCLRILDIRFNQINLASLMALSKTLYINQTLTSLLSDMRNMTATGDPLIATDAELILYLIDEIDGCLRRNRSLDQPSPSVMRKQTESPSSTSVGTIDVEPLCPNASPNPDVISDPKTDQDRFVEHFPVVNKVDLESQPNEPDSDRLITPSWSEQKLGDLRSSIEFSAHLPIAFSSEPVTLIHSPLDDSVKSAHWTTQSDGSSSATEDVHPPVSSDNPTDGATDHTKFDWDLPETDNSSCKSAPNFSGDALSPPSDSETSGTIKVSNYMGSNPAVTSTASTDAGLSRRTHRKHMKSSPSYKPLTT